MLRASAWTWAVLLGFLPHTIMAAEAEKATAYMDLRFKSEMRDELDLYAVDRAVRKIPGVKKTEGSWREKKIRVELQPEAAVPVAEVGRAVGASGHELKEMILECRGVYFREGYKNTFRSEPGGVVFQLAVGEKTRELEKQPQPARVRLRGRVNLERLTSPPIRSGPPQALSESKGPFALVVLWYAPDE
ncbi:MAG: hypothetical protein HYT87_05215 [Nitrospirae bacterium]|nr:hypothetical protein [Nitrospirota bacterium]